MVFKKGQSPWNKGLTKYTDERVAKYVSTHIGKPSGSLGKKWEWSDESRAKQSEQMKGNIPWNLGLNKENDLRLVKSANTLSETINNDLRLLEIRSMNGKLNKGQEAWNNKLTKEKDPRVAKYADKLLGIPKTWEHREKLSSSRLAMPFKERSRLGRIGGLASMAKLTSQERTEKAINAALSVPKNNTSIELILQKELGLCGITYTTQIPILDVTIVDIFIEPNICIYADGDYWHNYPNGRKKDRKQTKILQDKGYIVFRFWESEIKTDSVQCINKILEVIKKGKR